MKMINVAALAAAGVMVTAAGCGDLATATDPNLTASPRTSGDLGAKAGGGDKPQDDGLYEITYKISGSANRAMMTYTTPSGMEQTTEDVPWSKRFKARLGDFLSVSAQNEGASGTVTCTITVDGKVVKRARSKGAYSIAACDHSLGL